MASLRDYFLGDKNHEIKVTQGQELTLGGKLKVPVQMFLDFASGSIYLAYYVERTSEPVRECLALIDQTTIAAILRVSGGFAITGGFPNTNPIDAKDLKFCGRVYIYSDNQLSNDEQAALVSASRAKGILLEYYGPDWAAQRAQIEKPMAFISHDSRDKDEIAKPLVEELLRYPGCMVWFDEYSLKVGDKLRESIEKGLRESKKCVLILTKRFLSNNGWTKVEFNSVFTRELIEQANVVLPVWAGVSRDDVYTYSPALVNKLAAKWENGAKEVARQIFLAANAEIPN